MKLAEFVVDSNVWQSAIQAIVKLAVPFNGTINIVVNESVMIESRAELAAVSIKLPVESVSGSAKIGVVLENLRLASNKRGKITFAYEDTQLKISSGNYNSAINTVDYVPYDDIEKQSDLEFADLSEESCKWLSKSVKQVTLKPSLTTPIMPVLVKLGKKSSLVCCYALDHLSFIKTEYTVSKPIELSMPVDLLMNILSVFTECKIAHTDSIVACENDWISAYVSLPATDSYIESKTLLERLQMFMKQTDGSELELDKNEIVEFFGNAKAVASKERSELIFECDDSKTTITRSTSLGRASVEMPRASQSCSYKLDGEYFAEAINQCKNEKVKLTCYKNLGFTLINTLSSSYAILALNKD